MILLFIIIATAAAMIHIRRAGRARRSAAISAEMAAVEARVVLGAMGTVRRAPDHQIVAWTPEEREAFGLNDTMRFIVETDRILNEAEWDRLTGKQQVARLEESETVELRSWGNPEPVATYRDGAHQAAREKAFDEAPTVTGGRIFG